MAYYYRKVKCPYCNRWTDHFSSGSDVSLYSGSIVRTCRHCNKNFVDKSREEQALTYYKGTYRLRYVLAPLFFAVASTIPFIVLFGADGFVLPTAIFGILSAIFMYLFVKAIYETSPKYRKAALEEKKVSQTVLNSLDRLSDPDYLDLHVINGLQVPDWFYTRIGYSRESADEVWNKKVMKEEADYRELLNAQTRRRASKHLLHLGKRHPDFIKAANEMNMSVDEFSALCKKFIDEYDSIHRKYNEEHEKNAPYPDDI